MRLSRKKDTNPSLIKQNKGDILKLKALSSVGVKLFIIFLVSVTLLVVSIGLFSYDRSRTIVEEQLSLSQKQTLIQAGEKLDLLFNNSVKLSNQVLFDKQLHTNLSNVYRGDKSNSFELFEQTKQIESELKGYVFGNNTLFSMFFIPLENNGTPIFTSGTPSDALSTAREKAWFQEAVNKKGQPVWIPSSAKGVAEQSPKPIFSMARLVNDLKTNEPQFVMVMEIYVQSLADHLKWDQSQGGFIQIVDANGKLILDNDLSKLGQAPSIQLTPQDQATSGKQIVDSAEQGELLGSYFVSRETGWILNGFTPVQSIVKETNSIRNVTWISVGVGIIVAAFLGYYVMRMVGKPLKRLRDLMMEGAEGKLGLHMEHRSSDEIGQLSTSFNTMMERIKDLVQRTDESAQAVLLTAGQLSEASRSTASSAKEIALATEEIAKGAASLAVEAERSNDCSEQTTNKMQQVVEMNVEMFHAATEVQQKSQRGTSYMNELSTKTAATEHIVRSLVAKVDALKDSTQSVRQILDLLNQMTKQTNILSLNAAIEAARAGAAGKGFMVVADEIRGLADQSKQSIEVVGQITASIQREVDETVTMLGEAYPIFREQLGAVKEADMIFHGVESQMIALFEKLDSATSAVNEFDESQRIMTEAMSNVSAVAEQSSATSEEVASLSNEQMTVSNRLVELSNELEQVSNDLQERLKQFSIVQQ
ncbi:methyl-accepting chemotaxis protein [Paenibacillus sp. SC116]|uniref:methyl-accepting chemotaxis protein n=1 Tax=Paenibacillus sp. SC116 TaxID=2968986 RepID=UPI00215A4A96|nr:methyl-accepting chemotaxis protein [Paenibacillus sp. SC116]MCR8845961.1 methyl-accepting chemotaxis protein [Paenibacillus sp. SC116]